MRRIGDSGGVGRIAYFDNLKFILIAFVVLGHAIDPFSGVFPVYSRMYFFIYLFHMPLFMFVTGLFSRGALGYGGGDAASVDMAAGNRAPRGRGARRAAGFLVLYIMLNFSIFAVERFAAGKDVEFYPLAVRNASWYFLACCILTFACAMSGGAGRRLGAWQKALIIVAIALSAVMIGRNDAFGDFLSMSRIICFAPFFLAGLYIGPERIARFRRSLFTEGGMVSSRGAALALVAAIVLAAAAATVFFMPEQWLKIRGILTARNPYSYLGDLAAYGPFFRFMWYAAASVLGFCVMALVPMRKTFFTRLGGNTIGVYIWHLLMLRALGAAESVPALARLVETADASVRPALSLLPIALALVSVFLFSLRPPFGVAANRIMDTIYRGAAPRSPKGSAD